MKQSLTDLSKTLPPEIVNHIQLLERIRQDFVANVSHELRTPLTVMHGYLELLLDQPEIGEIYKNIFLQMQQQTLRMENLVENLLLLSQLESNEHKSKTEKAIDISELLILIVNEAKALSGTSNHKITLQCDEHLKLIGNSEELRSLFSNIIFNAVKYTPAEGEITVEWYKKNKQAYFSVKDTGIGIAAKHIPRLTERFYRVDPARSRESGGTGLGLAIVKHILIRHDGKLKVQSQIDKGSVFTCIFPQTRLI